MTFVVRTRMDAATLSPWILRAVAEVDPAQPIYDLETMSDRLAHNEALVRFELFTIGVFAAFAVLLVAIGLYGVVSYGVTQRGREIGLRLALGAGRVTVVYSVLRESAVLAVGGATLGGVASLALSRLLAASLFGVKPNDPFTLIAVGGSFLVIAIAAAYVPARRASAIQPMEALRAE